MTEQNGLGGPLSNTSLGQAADTTPDQETIDEGAAKAPPPGPASGPDGSFPSTDDRRTSNNVMRHNYRELTEREKRYMGAVKDAGLAFHDLIDQLEREVGRSRELSLAKTKIEEAVMWGVKHLTR